MDAVLMDGHLTGLLRIGAPSLRAVIKRGVIVHQR